MSERTEPLRRSTPTRQRGPLFEQPERLTYEAAIVARNPRMASLLALDPTTDGGAR